MSSYRLSQATIRRKLRLAFIRFQLAVIFLLAVLAGYLFSDPSLRWVAGLPIFLGVLALYGWIAVLHFRHERRRLHALHVDVTERDLRLFSGELLVHSARREDVYQIQEQHAGLRVSTYDYRHLTVPFGLAEDGDEKVRDALSTWTHIRPIPAYRYLSDWPLAIGLLVALFVLVLVNSLETALFFGGALAVYYLLVYLRTRWVYDIDPAAHQSYTLAMSFMIFIVILKLCVLVPMAMVNR